MDRWSRLWMGLKEVMKDVQQNQYMFLIATELRLANIVDNDVRFFRYRALETTRDECPPLPPVRSSWSGGTLPHV